LVMNMGLSGIAFTGPDTGGFIGTPDGELLIRWNQMSVFTPFFRNHTARGTADQEPWVFGKACERLSREFIELRYRLLPYLYTAFWQSAQTGMPIARPLFLHFQDDEHAAGIDDQFMCGDAFLVAPIYERGATSRRIYIPQGYWYNFWDNGLTAGPHIARLPAPIHHIPLLVRAGHIVPTWPVMQHTGEQPVQTLTLHVYPGNGTSQLYKDDGRTWDFQDGHYRVTQFVSTLVGSVSAPERLTIQRSIQPPPSPTARANVDSPLPAYERIRILLHGISSPHEIRVDGRTVSGLEYDAGLRTLSFDAERFETINVLW
jgi:alpha-glucosidase